MSGTPAKLFHNNNPDWLPTLKLGRQLRTKTSDVAASGRRYERLQGRREKAATASPGALASRSDDEEVQAAAVVDIDFSEEMPPDDEDEYRSVDTSAADVKVLSDRVRELTMENGRLKSRVSQLMAQPFSENALGKDEDVRLYTGLPSAAVLKSVFMFVTSGMVPHHVGSKLSPFQEFCIALTKLRLNSRLHELAFQVGLSESSASRLLRKWFTALDIRLSFLIHWPDHEELQKTMPQCCIKSFGKKVAVIIDCFEIFIDRPSNLMARAQTWSNCKHHNTIKVCVLNF